MARRRRVATEEVSDLLLKQEFELVEVDRLKPHPENPRKGDEETIGNSIDGNKFYGACIVQRSTGHVLVGNHRSKVLRERGGGVGACALG